MAQFTNQAKIFYNGVSADSNIVTGEITQVISIRKNATVSEYHKGEILTYVIHIQNAGTTDYENLIVTEDLGAYPFGALTLTPLTFTGDPVLYYSNGILQTAPSVTAGPPLVISGIRVLAGTNTTLIYRTRVNEYAPLGVDGEITNTVVVSGGGISERIDATETVTAATEPNLSIIKRLEPATVVENGRVVYTFTIQNTGAAAEAEVGLIVTDTFRPALAASIAVTRDGTTWVQENHYTYDADSGEFATQEGALTVPAASYVQDPASGIWHITPGVTMLTVTGTI